MRALGEVLRGFFKEDPRRKELAGLVSTFRGQVERLLGEEDTRGFSLSNEETRRLRGFWETPVKITMGKTENGLRVDIRSEVFGEALELKGNKPRFWETGSIGAGYWEALKPGGDLGLDILRLKEWITYVTVLEGLQKNPQTASSAPITP